MFGLSAESLASPAVLLGVVFLMTMFGLLVPGPTHRGIVKRQAEEIGFLRDRNKEQAEQITILSGSSETALHIGDEIRRLAGSTRPPLAPAAGEEGSP